jgi:hypothetical protein
VGVDERGEIDGNIIKHEGPPLALIPRYVKDDNEAGELPGEQGEGGGNLKEKVGASDTKMCRGGKDELDE